MGRPTVTVLQLDTDFPRVPGDVGCHETFLDEIEILRIPGASVGEIVSADPAAISIAPFEKAVVQAHGDIIVTSCGFLSYWQDYLARLTPKPFISSALTALPELCKTIEPKDILTVTFDADSLNENHFGSYQTDVIGLPKELHLRQVIAENRPSLDVDLAARELTGFVAAKQKPNHQCILLECTNLPPYKQVLSAQTGLPIHDILTLMETARAGTIQPKFK